MKVIRLIGIASLALVIAVTFAATAAAQGNKSPDLLTKQQVTELTASAKTAADHMKLSKHYAALAAKYEAESADHAANAKVEHTRPNAAETKRPGSPDTALHCERLSDSLRVAAQQARAVAAAHEDMAKLAK